MANLEEIRTGCWTEALHCLGTSYIFEVRANLLRFRLRMLTFLGVLVPASIGGVAAAFGLDAKFTAWFVAIAAIFGLVQLVGTLWSLAYRWEDEFGYALESLSANRVLFEKYQVLAKTPPATVEEAAIEQRLIATEAGARSSADEKQGISLEEKRMGMHAGLFQFGKACAGCGKVPTSMEPTDCDVCGNFKVRRY